MILDLVFIINFTTLMYGLSAHNTYYVVVGAIGVSSYIVNKLDELNEKKNQ